MKHHEVLVKVHAASVTDYDKQLSKGLQSPAKTGLEFSGEVTSVGDGISDYVVGDQVYGYMNFWKGAKTHNEFIAVPTAYMSHKPNHISHEEAASIPVGMLTTMRALREIGKLKQGQHIFINGASGGVGVYAVQYAKHLGAYVTAACSADHTSFVRALGADRVLDYRKVNFIKDTDEQYDLIFDVANQTTYAQCKRRLKPRGIYVTTNPLKDPAGFILSLFSSKKSRFLMVSHGDHNALAEAAHLVESGIIQPVIDRTFPFHQATEAYSYYRTKCKRGRVILKLY